MTVKRTELEILDMAILLSEQRQRRINDADRLEKSPCGLCKEYHAEKKWADDLEKTKRHYERLLNETRQELREEAQKEKDLAVIQADICGLSSQIDLLRWLYKEEDERK